MLKRLDADGFHDYLRLGHERSVSSDIQQHLLKHVVLTNVGAQFIAPVNPTNTGGRVGVVGGVDGRNELRPYISSPNELQALVRDLLRRTPVVASTTATWSSDKYDLQMREDGGEGNHEVDAPFQFDVAIIDEASQLTIPAILGALRFARRFILVGDEKRTAAAGFEQRGRRARSVRLSV